MLQSLIVGIGLTVGLVVLWTLIQAQWKNAFREEYLHEDVLAGRRSCSDCGCTAVCERKANPEGTMKKAWKNEKDQTSIIEHLTTRTK